MAGKVLNIKVFNPLKLRSSLTGKKPATCHLLIQLTVNKRIGRKRAILKQYDRQVRFS